MAAQVWRYIVRPIAVGGMLVGAALHAVQHAHEPDHRHRPRVLANLRHAARDPETLQRTERYMSSKVVFSLIGGDVPV